MPTAIQITCTQHDRNGVRCQALFSSALQPSDAPTPGMVATAISRAIQQFGIGGCTGRMAQEFGDHPDAAPRGCAGPASSSPKSPQPSGSRVARVGAVAAPEWVICVLMWMPD